MRMRTCSAAKAMRMRKKIILFPNIIPDERPEDGVEQGFMLFMKPKVHPFPKAGCTDLGNA
jgi:hypothetical protein